MNKVQHFYTILPWVMLIINAAYEGSTYNSTIGHARATVLIAVVISVLVGIGIALGESL